MDPRQQIKAVKLSTAKDRCGALRGALRAFRARVQSSPGTKRVLDATETALNALDSYLTAQEQDPDLALLDDHELEAKIHFASQNIRVLAATVRDMARLKFVG